MELIKIECDLTAIPLNSREKPTSKTSISIKLRRFRQTVDRKPNGDETIKEHKQISPPTEISHQIYSVSEIESVLNKSTLNVNNWVRNRVSDLLSSKAGSCMKEGKAYTVKAEVDVIFEKIHHSTTESEIQKLKVDEEEEEEEKSCAICLGEFKGEVRCTQIRCSHDHHRCKNSKCSHRSKICTEFQCCHVFHRACIWKWLRKSMSCPYCRRCVCGKESCNCSIESDTY